MIVCLRKDRVARTAPVSITNVTAMTVTEDADVRLQVRCHYHFFLSRIELLAQFFFVVIVFNCLFYCDQQMRTNASIVRATCSLSAPTLWVASRVRAFRATRATASPVQVRREK